MSTVGHSEQSKTMLDMRQLPMHCLSHRDHSFKVLFPGSFVRCNQFCEPYFGVQFKACEQKKINPLSYEMSLIALNSARSDLLVSQS